MLSEAVQDYLKSIYKLGRSPEVETMVSTTLIAERMGVSAASATNTVGRGPTELGHPIQDVASEQSRDRRSGGNGADLHYRGGHR